MDGNVHGPTVTARRRCGRWLARARPAVVLDGGGGSGSSGRAPCDSGSALRWGTIGAPVVIDGVERDRRRRRTSAAGSATLRPHGLDDADGLLQPRPGFARHAGSRRSPIPGLHRHGRDRRDLFVGREAAVERLLDGFTRRFVAVVGAREGEDIIRTRWPGAASASTTGRFDVDHDDRMVLSLSPGGGPNRALDDALPPHDAVLIVDQLEELVTLCRRSRGPRGVRRPDRQPSGWPGRVAARRSLRRVGVYRGSPRGSASQLLLGPLVATTFSAPYSSRRRNAEMTVEDDWPT